MHPAAPNRVLLLQRLADGATVAQIAREVGLSYRMVLYYLSILQDEWGARNLPHLVARALAAGVIH